MSDRTADYYATLESTEREIRDGFTAHFAGKPGSTVPHLAFVGGYDQIVPQAAREAVKDALDYDDTDNALHGLLQGSVSVEQLREAIVQRYIAMHADDIVWLRTGLSMPRRSQLQGLGDAMAAPFPAFLMREAA